MPRREELKFQLENESRMYYHEYASIPDCMVLSQQRGVADATEYWNWREKSSRY